MTKLVIAEKPSVGRALAAVLGAKSKKEGYFEGNGYVVSWAIGHLLGLADPKAYDVKYEKWRVADLPVLPAKWQYAANYQTRAQLKVLKELLKRADIDTVVNACDAGREGELIFRLIYNHCGCKKPIERLWISSMEESAITDGFSNLRKGADYDNLYQAAVCRSQADWAVGMNYSRLYGCLYNIIGCSIGRVQTPTLVMICERMERINNFVKEPFYTVEAEGLGFTAVTERINDKAAAETVVAKCTGKVAVIQSIEKKDKTMAAPKLYDLTTLQRSANKLFGYSAKQTLEYAQNLYEKKLITYPRTDSRYLTDDMRGGLPALAGSIGKYLPLPADVLNAQNYSFSQVINNAKVSDHHAIIPTLQAANANLAAAQGEKNILFMVAARFLTAVSPKHEYAETTVKVVCEDETFTAKGKTVTAQGWRAVEDGFTAMYFKKNETTKNAKDAKKGETDLPFLTQGERYNPVFAMKEGFTSPPKPFTEDTLLSAMENATADEVDLMADIERKGIGTPATRAEVIEKLLKQEYIVRKDKQLLPTEKGINLVKVLPDSDSVKSPILTAEWENELKRVERGETTAAAFMNAVTAYVRNTVAANQTVPDDRRHLITPIKNSTKTGAKKNAPTAEMLGKCPRCGNSITENKAAFSCTNQDAKCKFALFKESYFFKDQKITLTKELAVALITEGRVTTSKPADKSGKTYNITIVLQDDGTNFPKFAEQK